MCSRDAATAAPGRLLLSLYEVRTSTVICSIPTSSSDVRYGYWDTNGPCHCGKRGGRYTRFSQVQPKGLKDGCSKIGLSVFSGVCYSGTGLWSLETSRSLGRDETFNPVSRSYGRSAGLMCRDAHPLYSRSCLQFRAPPGDRRSPVQRPGSGTEQQGEPREKGEKLHMSIAVLCNVLRDQPKGLSLSSCCTARVSQEAIYFCVCSYGENPCKCNWSVVTFTFFK